LLQNGDLILNEKWRFHTNWKALFAFFLCWCDRQSTSVECFLIHWWNFTEKPLHHFRSSIRPTVVLTCYQWTRFEWKLEAWKTFTSSLDKVVKSSMGDTSGLSSKQRTRRFPRCRISRGIRRRAHLKKNKTFADYIYLLKQLL